MAATQVFLALCVAGVAVAAPRSEPRSAAVSGGDEQVVTSVISSLTPAIAKAVEEALAALNGQAAAEAEALRIQQEQEAEAFRLYQEQEAAAEALRIQQEQEAAAAAAAAEEYRQQQIAAEEYRQQQIAAEEYRQQQIADANAAAAAAALEKASFETDVSVDLGPFTRPVYNFEYKVADEEAQTYISRNEERDGDELTGSYSYVDATGALVKVDYTAGVNGYLETRTVEAGFVTPRVIPPWTGPLAGIDDTVSGSIAARTPAPVAIARPVTRFRPVTRVSSSSTSESDLIARILAALTPQINSAVTAALA